MPGHWEGDFIKGAGNKSSVGVLVANAAVVWCCWPRWMTLLRPRRWQAFLPSSIRLPSRCARACLRLVKIVPQPLDAILADSVVSVAANRISRRRAGASAAGSVDETIRERLQAIQRAGQIAYDPAITLTMTAGIDEALTRLDC